MQMISLQCFVSWYHNVRRVECHSTDYQVDAIVSFYKKDGQGISRLYYIHVSDVGAYVCLLWWKVAVFQMLILEPFMDFSYFVGEQCGYIMIWFFLAQVSSLFVSRDLSSHVAASSIRCSGCYSRLDRVWLFHCPCLWLDIRYRRWHWLRRIRLCWQFRRWDRCVRVWDSANSLGHVRSCRESFWLWRVRLGYDFGRLQSQWLVADTFCEPTSVSLFWHDVLAMWVYSGQIERTLARTFTWCHACAFALSHISVENQQQSFASSQ